MRDGDTTVAYAVRSILKRIREAAVRAGRHEGDITLVAASKGVGVEGICEAAASGVTNFGENRVYEARAKFSPIPLSHPLFIHLIGSLQTNKVKEAVGFFNLIHSIDSLHLAQKIEQEAEKQAITQPVLVEVNIGGEAGKHGVSIEATPLLVDAIRALPHLSLLGLMAIPPKTSISEEARPHFSKLRTLGNALGLNRFSMGMSSDFEVAVEEGATWVRVGTAIFGPRPPWRRMEN